MVSGQLDFLLPYSLIADAVIFLASLPLYGFGTEVPLGLLLGTAAMAVNITLLGCSSERAVEKSSKKAAKRYMFFFYLVRMTIMGAAMVLGFTSPAINSAAVCLPLFYPKVIYTVYGVITARKGG